MGLAALYAKAAVGALGPRGRDLPGTVLEREVHVDRAELAEHARVCGYPVDDTLPPTYPHLLGFGLQVELMAARSFPLALPGLVHVRNTITAHRALDAAEPLTVRVHAERFGPHPKGAQVDLVTAVDAGGQRVWDGRSTYLARGAKAPPAAVPADAPAGPQRLPDEVPATAVWHVDAGTGRRYAAVSGDINPIHLHPLTARAFGFPRAIAHGMWTAARALASLQGRRPAALAYDVAFGKPLLLPSTVELRVRAAGGGHDLEVRSGKGAVHLTAAVRPSG